jgi:hypothetical protein
VGVQLATDRHDLVPDRGNPALQVTEQHLLRNRHCAILAPLPATTGDRTDPVRRVLPGALASWLSVTAETTIE